MVAYKEAAELAEKGFLTSSCCPAFVSYIKKNFPTMVDKISHNLSPAAEIGRYIKETTPGAKVVHRAVHREENGVQGRRAGKPVH